MEKLNKSFISVSDLAKFNACVLEVLNKEALIKKKFIRANKALFMTRKLKKAMKANADKCHLLLSTKEKLKAKISSDTIMSSAKEKLLGKTINNHLNFESYIKNLHSKASQKL